MEIMYWKWCQFISQILSLFFFFNKYLLLVKPLIYALRTHVSMTYLINSKVIAIDHVEVSS